MVRVQFLTAVGTTQLFAVLDALLVHTDIVVVHESVV